MSKTMFESDIEQSDFVVDVKTYVMMNASERESKEALEALLKKYDIALETFHYRVRSLFGKGTRQLRKEFFTPSKELMKHTLLRCNTVQEFWDVLKVPVAYRKGLFDEAFGTSNFTSAKALVTQSSFAQVVYNPNIRDNEALVAALFLGDGSYDKKRCSLRIEHGHNQEEWLRTKVRMFKKAYPFVSGEEKIKSVVRNDYESFTYYSGKLMGKAKSVIERCLDGGYEEFFTPLFIWMIFLDDGCKSGLTHQICYGSNGVEFGEALQRYLISFGIESVINEDSMSLLIRKKLSRVKFNNLLQQFKPMTPNCLLFKLSYDL